MVLFERLRSPSTRTRASRPICQTTASLANRAKVWVLDGITHLQMHAPTTRTPLDLVRVDGLDVALVLVCVALCSTRSTRTTATRSATRLLPETCAARGIAVGLPSDGA
ncbi:hypothetical protein [Streptomyces sp. NPDC048560]|uniref:hypothetical protein n=1 Tax=Streptomyces sp. NPDC048560 TaxID=3155488 RepID=UPI003437ED8A